MATAKRSKYKSEVVNDADLRVNDGRSKDSDAREARYAILATTVDNDIREAIAARQTSGIEEIWADDDDQYNGIDSSVSGNGIKSRDQVPRGAAQSGRSKVVVPITKPKTDIGVARVSEMLLPNDDKPWDIGPTPMPDIDEQIDAPLDKKVQLGDGTEVPAAMAAQFLKDKAKEFAKLEATYIEDKFAEGEVYSHMRQVLRDAGRIGTGVLKGPMPVRRITKKWHVERIQDHGKPLESGNVSTNPQVINRQNALSGATARLEIIESIEPTSVCVQVQDCFPDPACGDSIHDGAFFAHREYITGKKLRELAFLPGYDAACIVEGLKAGPMSYARRNERLNRTKSGDTNYDAKLFEVIYYYGDASPEDLAMLMERGNPYPAESQSAEDDAEDEFSPLDSVLSKEDQMYLKTVPVMVTMLNGKPIKAELNPMEVGGFPFDFFPWEPVKGQPYGRGIPHKMAVAARILNASVRALLENAGLSAGAQIVTTKGAITPWTGGFEVTGRKGWNFNPDSGIDDVRKAFAVFTIPSVTEELRAIIQLALDFADQLTNLPMLMQGDQQAGTSPETLGGMKLLFNNAMSPLRVIAKLFDDRLIVPHLKRYHDWAMEKGPENIKGGDSQIIAKGSTALIQREEGREFLMQVFPVKDDPKLRIDPAKMIQEMARANGFDMTTIQYTEDEWKQVEADAAKNAPPPEPAVEAARIRSQALVDAAKINAEASQHDLEFKERSAVLDRAHEAAMAQVDREIATMEHNDKRQEALITLKARLAESAAKNRLTSEELSLKLTPANKSGTGI
jgi:hypothetical protein